MRGTFRSHSGGIFIKQTKVLPKVKINRLSVQDYYIVIFTACVAKFLLLVFVF